MYGIPRATHDVDLNVFIVAVQQDHLVYLVESMYHCYQILFHISSIIT